MTGSNIPNPSGAHPLTPNEDRRKKRPWWLLVLAAIIVLVVLGLILRSCSSSDTKKAAGSAVGSVTAASSGSVTGSASADATSASAVATASASTTPAGSASATTTSAVAGTDGAILTVDSTTLLPATAGSNANLARYVGKEASAKGALVLSSPADNGFWIGTTTKDEVWVQLLLPGLVSPHPVRKGDHVSFPATVVANPAGFAKTAGVTDTEGASRLTAQQAHLQVKKTDITFTG